MSKRRARMGGTYRAMAAVTLGTLLATAALATGAAEPEPQAGLKVTVRREGVVPYLPHASYRISIQAPPEKLLEGWRCCWIEAFSRPTAKALSAQWQTSVAGNDPQVQLDANRSEHSLREVAPGRFEGNLWLSARQAAGSHTARIYIHLYQPQDGHATRIASQFLQDPFISVRFMYPHVPQPLPLRPGDVVPGAPPSQLPSLRSYY
jgi:hypothetical protein